MPALDAFSLDGHSALRVAERITADGAAAGTAKDGYITGQVLPVDGGTVI
jgi:hypothetical protein